MKPPCQKIISNFIKKINDKLEKNSLHMSDK